jgi:hypothetical protein
MQLNCDESSWERKIMSTFHFVEDKEKEVESLESLTRRHNTHPNDAWPNDTQHNKKLNL